MFRIFKIKQDFVNLVNVVILLLKMYYVIQSYVEGE